MPFTPGRSDGVIPRHADNVDTETVGGELLLYHPALTRAVYLNPTAALVWGLCDGQRSVREIVGLIENAYPDTPAASLSEDVHAALTSLQQGGVLHAR